MNENDLEQKLIVTYSPVYQRYQSSTRKKQVERAIKKTENPSSLNKHNQNDPKRFIKTTHVTNEGEIADRLETTINQEQIDKEAKYDGFYAVCTNLESSVEEIIKINKGRWEIEETFRILKSEFQARPVFLRRETRIKAHFLTCFLSLLIFRILYKYFVNHFKYPKLLSYIKYIKT